MTSEGIFYLEELAEVIETVLHSAAIRDEIPVSIILVGPSGSAKSKLLKYYDCEAVHTTDSVTSQGLWEIVQRDTKNEKNFILIPDINPTLSRRNSTTQATVGNLLTITGDGTVRIDDGRGEKICKHRPMGLITACTPEIYHKNAKTWYALGLIRRVIPLFYNYSGVTLDSIMKLVREGKIHSSFGVPKKFNVPPPARPVLNGTCQTEIELRAKTMAINLGKQQFTYAGKKSWKINEVLAISPHVTLRTLAMSHALKRKSTKVEEIDALFISSFVSFTDPANPRQL